MTLSPSSRRHMIAAVFGAAGGGLAAAFVDTGLILASAVLCAAMAAITLEDALRFRVPDQWVFGALAAGLVWSVAAKLRAGDGVLAAAGVAFASAAVCGGVFLAVREAFFRLRGSDGLGLGDVKLAAAGGAWLGLELFPVAVLVAVAGSFAFILTRIARGGGWTASRRLAFGAFLAPAVWATWLCAHAFGNA